VPAIGFPLTTEATSVRGATSVTPRSPLRKRGSGNDHVYLPVPPKVTRIEDSMTLRRQKPNGGRFFVPIRPRASGEASFPSSNSCHPEPT